MKKFYFLIIGFLFFLYSNTFASLRLYSYNFADTQSDGFVLVFISAFIFYIIFQESRNIKKLLFPLEKTKNLVLKEKLNLFFSFLVILNLIILFAYIFLETFINHRFNYLGEISISLIIPFIIVFIIFSLYLSKKLLFSNFFESYFYNKKNYIYYYFAKFIFIVLFLFFLLLSLIGPYIILLLLFTQTDSI